MTGFSRLGHTLKVPGESVLANRSQWFLCDNNSDYGREDGFLAQSYSEAGSYYHLHKQLQKDKECLLL